MTPSQEGGSTLCAVTGVDAASPIEASSAVASSAVAAKSIATSAELPTSDLPGSAAPLEAGGNAAVDNHDLDDLAVEQAEVVEQAASAASIDTLGTSAAAEPEAAAPSGFASFGFGPELLETLSAIGYEQPSPIQEAAIPELLLGRDLVGQAQTGTGKTAAFALPLLARLDPEQRKPQVLVLAPTRELAMQVADAFNTYASRLPNVRVLAVYGGADFRDQIQQLRRGVQIVVGTPGRVMDHMRQGTLDLSGLRALVLDEADEMLRMGFIDDVEWVLEQLPSERQVVLFSATMPAEIRRISHNYLRQPAEVTIRTKAADGGRIRQRYLMVHGPHKLPVLQRVLEAESSEGTIIFARTKAITLTVAEFLESHGYEVAVLNGDVPQAQRERTIERLKDGRVDVLVATDVAARGLDVERVGLVVNYDMPFDGEAYVHRIGRTGRAGRSGEAILFLTPRERRFLGGLERAVGRAIEPMEVPSNATINQNRLDRLRQKLTNGLSTPIGTEEERALLSEILQRVAQEHEVSSEQLALVALQMSLIGKPLLLHGDEQWSQPASRGPARDGRSGSGSPRDRDGGTRRMIERRPAAAGRDGRSSTGAPRSQEASPVDADMDRFRIEVGWRDRIKPGNIVGAIANEAGIAGKMIGRIHIFDAHSTVDLPKGMPEDVFDNLRRLRVMNRELQITKLS